MVVAQILRRWNILQTNGSARLISELRLVSCLSWGLYCSLLAMWPISGQRWYGLLPTPTTPSLAGCIKRVRLCCLIHHDTKQSARWVLGIQHDTYMQMCDATQREVLYPGSRVNVWHTRVWQNVSLWLHASVSFYLKWMSCPIERHWLRHRKFALDLGMASFHYVQQYEANVSGFRNESMQCSFEAGTTTRALHASSVGWCYLRKPYDGAVVVNLFKTGKFIGWDNQYVLWETCLDFSRFCISAEWLFDLWRTMPSLGDAFLRCWH